MATGSGIDAVGRPDGGAGDEIVVVTVGEQPDVRVLGDSCRSDRSVPKETRTASSPMLSGAPLVGSLASARASWLASTRRIAPSVWMT